ARGRTTRQHLRRRGTSGDRHGHVVRQSGPLDRVRGAAGSLAREQGLPSAGGDRRADRPPEARDDGRRDRPAHRGAGEVPRLLGRGHLSRAAIVALALLSPTAPTASASITWQLVARGNPRGSPDRPTAYVALDRPSAAAFAASTRRRRTEALRA